MVDCGSQRLPPTRDMDGICSQGEANGVKHGRSVEVAIVLWSLTPWVPSYELDEARL